MTTTTRRPIPPRQQEVLLHLDDNYHRKSYSTMTTTTTVSPIPPRRQQPSEVLFHQGDNRRQYSISWQRKNRFAHLEIANISRNKIQIRSSTCWKHRNNTLHADSPTAWALWDSGSLLLQLLQYPTYYPHDCYLRGLECLCQLVLQLPAMVDGEDAEDGDANCSICPHILQHNIWTIIYKQVEHKVTRLSHEKHTV